MKLDIEQFIPEKLRSRELFAEIQEVIQHFTDEELQQFNDVMLKYKDPFNINNEAAMQVISELGYDYIVDVFETLTNEELGTIISYMGLIHLLKGSTPGLRLIFSLLKLQYEMIQWYERGKDRRKGRELDAPVLDTLEWKMIIDINSSPNLTNLFYTIPKLKNFTRNYVYPVLAYIEMIYSNNIDTVGIWGCGSHDEIVADSYYDTQVNIAYVMTVMDEIENVVVIQDFDAALFENRLLMENRSMLYTEADKDILKLE